MFTKAYTLSTDTFFGHKLHKRLIKQGQRFCVYAQDSKSAGEFFAACFGPHYAVDSRDEQMRGHVGNLLLPPHESNFSGPYDALERVNLLNDRKINSAAILLNSDRTVGSAFISVVENKERRTIFLDGPEFSTGAILNAINSIQFKS